MNLTQYINEQWRGRYPAYELIVSNKRVGYAWLLLSGVLELDYHLHHSTGYSGQPARLVFNPFKQAEVSERLNLISRRSP